MSKPNGPFCWQNKETLRGIRESMDACANLPSILGVYHALTEIASNEQSNQFTATRTHIAQLAGGISMKTVGRCLKELRELEIISTELSRLRGPLKFDLLRDGTWIPNDRTLSPNVGTTGESQLSVSRRTLEESSEEKDRLVGKRSKSPTQSLPPIPAELDTPLFRTAWEEWIQHRREIKKPLTPSSASKQLKDLAGWGECVAIAAIDVSIRNGWTGLFEPKGFVPSPVVQTYPKVEAPEGWEEILKELHPDAVSMTWEELVQLHQDVAEYVRLIAAQRHPDMAAIAQNAP